MSTATVSEVKKEVFVSYVDSNGKELARALRSKGRQNAQAKVVSETLIEIPNCSISEGEGLKAKEVNGKTIYVPTSVIEKAPVFYITLDSAGKVVSKEAKGRGKARTSFQLATNGEHAGNWVKVETAAVKG